MAGRGIDSSLVMQTPEGIEYVLYPAGLTVRTCAWGIDSLIKGVILFGLIIFTSYVMDIFGIWFYFLVNFVLDWFYFVVFEIVWNGQTPGKRIMGIRVVSGDGSPVSAGSSFLRNLLRFADGFFYLYLIAFVCMIASPGFRRIGDWAGDTLVIYTSGSRLPRRFGTGPGNSETISWLKDIPAAAFVPKFSYEEKQGLMMFTRRYPLLGKKRAGEIARPWAGLLRARTDNPVQSEISDSDYLLGMARSLSGG